MPKSRKRVVRAAGRALKGITVSPNEKRILKKMMPRIDTTQSDAESIRRLRRAVTGVATLAAPQTIRQLRRAVTGVATLAAPKRAPKAGMKPRSGRLKHLTGPE
jgi:hypothetical protein